MVQPMESPLSPCLPRPGAVLGRKAVQTVLSGKEVHFLRGWETNRSFGEFVFWGKYRAIMLEHVRLDSI